MSDHQTEPAAASKTRIDVASTEVCPDAVPESAFSSTPGNSGSRNTDPKTILTVHATPYGYTFAVLVPKSIIPDHERKDVLEVWVSRPSDAKNVPLYTTHLPGYKRAYLDLFQLDAKLHEEFRISQVRKYAPEAFVSAYNAAKPSGLENTKLAWDEKFWMKVDGLLVELNGPKFRTHQGQVILDAGLGDAGAVKVTKCLEAFAIRLRDHSPVTSIRTTSGRIVMTYSRTDHDAYAHRRQVSDPETFEPKHTLPETSKLSFATKQRWRETHDIYVIEANRPTITLVQAMLASTRNLDEFREVKGDIGEEMVRQVLPGIEMELIADHPWNTQWWLTGSRRLGPDLLVRMGAMKRLYYIEVKWWGEIDNAYAKAERQVIEDCEKYPTFNSEKIAGGFVAIVSWKAEDGTILLQVTRAKRKAALK